MENSLTYIFTFHIMDNFKRQLLPLYNYIGIQLPVFLTHPQKIPLKQILVIYLVYLKGIRSKKIPFCSYLIIQNLLYLISIQMCFLHQCTYKSIHILAVCSDNFHRLTQLFLNDFIDRSVNSSCDIFSLLFQRVLHLYHRTRSQTSLHRLFEKIKFICYLSSIGTVQL